MAKRLISVEEWKRLSEEKRQDIGVIRAGPMTVLRQEGDDDPESRIRDFIISTDAVDRMGDTIAPKGWDLKSFKKGGSVLFAHKSSDLPIARPEDTKVSDGKLISSAAFPDKGVYPFADTVLGLIDFGALRAASVGFLPKEWKVSEERDDGTSFFPPLDFTKQELLEWSVVPVPANPEALVSAKSAGIDLIPYVDWCERTLSDAKGPGLWVPREAIERARRTLVPAPVQVPDNITSSVAEPATAAEPATDSDPVDDVTSDPESTPELDLEVIDGDTEGDATPDSASADDGTPESDPEPEPEPEPAADATPDPESDPAPAADPEPAPAASDPEPAEPSAEPATASVPADVNVVAADIASLIGHLDGRTLSGANEDRLRRAQALLAEVIDQLDAQVPPDVDNDDADEAIFEFDGTAEEVRSAITESIGGLA